MSKTVKIVLIVIIAIAILFGLIKWVILPMTIQKQASDVIDDVIESGKFTTTEKNMFNAQFTVYEGSQKGTVVKSLIKMVEENNESSDRKVSVDFKGTTYSNSNVSSVLSLISASDIYNITIKYSSDKYVEIISIV